MTQYLDEFRLDKMLITLTHVCQRWREVLTTCVPSVWTRLSCTNVEKTRVYIERSKSLPLEIVLRGGGTSRYHKDAFDLVVPHISRVGSITLTGGGDLFKILTTHFSCHVPLLKILDVNLTCTPHPALNAMLFNGHLPSLCKLSLSGVHPHLPWNILPKLTSFELCCVKGEQISVTQLLDVFENATFLRNIKLNPAPSSSDAPPGRVVPLPCLQNLTIITDRQPSPTLLDHLTIPLGTFLHLEFDIPGNESLLRKHLPKTTDNLHNVSYVTSVSLDFSEECVTIHLKGPSGELYLCCCRDLSTLSHLEITTSSDRMLLRSLDNLPLSRVQKLEVAMYECPACEGTDKSDPHYILGGMGDLRTLSLDQCNNLPFILALNPAQDPSELILCPKLESLYLYTEHHWADDMPKLLAMVEERASKGVGLQSITFVSYDELEMEEDLSRLEEYVACVECRVEEGPPILGLVPWG